LNRHLKSLTLSAVMALALAPAQSGHAQQTLYGAGFSNGDIYTYDSSGNQSIYATGIRSITFLAFNSGDLFADAGGTIFEFTPQGVKSTFANGLSQLEGLAINSSGDLFAASQSTDKIYEFTPQGVESTFATGLFSPEGLAFDSHGNLYEADNSTQSINEFTPQGVESTFASTGGGVFGLAFQPAAVPEANTLLDLGSLLVCVGFLRQRRRR
jgi:sugar lactone lactonase YvrE